MDKQKSAADVKEEKQKTTNAKTKVKQDPTSTNIVYKQRKNAKRKFNNEEEKEEEPKTIDGKKIRTTLIQIKDNDNNSSAKDVLAIVLGIIYTRMHKQQPHQVQNQRNSQFSNSSIFDRRNNGLNGTPLSNFSQKNVEDFSKTKNADK